MKKSYLLLSLLAMASCTQNELVEPSVPQDQEPVQPGQQEVKGIVMTGVDYTFDGIASRSQVNHAVTPEGQNIGFQWKKGDMVGIFPMASNDGTEIKNEGTQVTFPMADGAGTSQAKFDGGGWALKSGYKYASYFPLVNKLLDLDKKQIPVSYANPVYREVAAGGNVTVDLGNSDFMTAEASAADANGNINFEFHHTGALIILNTELTHRSFTQVKSIKLKGYDPQKNNEAINFIVNGYVDLTQPLKTSESGTRKYHVFVPGTQPGDEVTELVFDCNDANQTSVEKYQWTFPIYFTMAPQNLADKMLELDIEYTTENLGTDGSHTSKNRIFVTKNIEPGKAYIWNARLLNSTNSNFYVEEPGTLSKMMGTGYAPTSLTVDGKINETDIEHIKTLAQLESIGLKAVTIVGSNPDHIPAGIFDHMTQMGSISLPRTAKTIAPAAFAQFTNAASCTLYIYDNFADLASVTDDGRLSFAGATFKEVSLIVKIDESEVSGNFYDVDKTTHTIDAHYDDMIYASNITEALDGGAALKVTGKLSDRDLKAIATYSANAITSLTFDNVDKYVPTADVFKGCTYSEGCDLVIPDAWKDLVSAGTDGKMMFGGVAWKFIKSTTGKDFFDSVNPTPGIDLWTPGEGDDLETE